MSVGLAILANMKYKKILVTGGAGFVGSHICISLRKYSNVKVIALDNLSRKGSDLNLKRLKDYSVEFVKGDVRNFHDLDIKQVDLVIECCADPSVMAGLNSSSRYTVETNLVGAINCFELAKKYNADVIFISTSRVYPVLALNNLRYKEESTRFSLESDQNVSGASNKGINEEFSLSGIRSLYGATKLSAELLLHEYSNNYGIKTAIFRSGLIAGPWQMGKSDQGIISFWIGKHIFNKPLSYIGFGGEGKQVRDVLDIDDLVDLVLKSVENVEQFNGKIYNIGGGVSNSISLAELTASAQKLTNNKIKIGSDKKTRAGDVRIYISDNSKIERLVGWKPKRTVNQTLESIYGWIKDNRNKLDNLFS